MVVPDGRQSLTTDLPKDVGDQRDDEHRTERGEIPKRTVDEEFVRRRWPRDRSRNDGTLGKDFHRHELNFFSGSGGATALWVGAPP